MGVGVCKFLGEKIVSNRGRQKGKKAGGRQTDGCPTTGCLAICLNSKGVGVPLTPMAVSPRDSHQISPTIGAATQHTDFTKGFSKGFVDKILRRRSGEGQGGPDPLVLNIDPVYSGILLNIHMICWERSLN